MITPRKSAPRLPLIFRTVLLPRRVAGDEHHLPPQREVTYAVLRNRPVALGYVTDVIMRDGVNRDPHGTWPCLIRTMPDELFGENGRRSSKPSPTAHEAQRDRFVPCNGGDAPPLAGRRSLARMFRSHQRLVDAFTCVIASVRCGIQHQHNFMRRLRNHFGDHPFHLPISSIRGGWVGSRSAVSAITTSMPWDKGRLNGIEYDGAYRAFLKTTVISCVRPDLIVRALPRERCRGRQQHVFPGRGKARELAYRSGLAAPLTRHQFTKGLAQDRSRSCAAVQEARAALPQRFANLRCVLHALALRACAVCSRRCMCLHAESHESSNAQILEKCSSTCARRRKPRQLEPRTRTGGGSPCAASRPSTVRRVFYRFVLVTLEENNISGLSQQYSKRTAQFYSVCTGSCISMLDKLARAAGRCWC